MEKRQRNRPPPDPSGGRGAGQPGFDAAYSLSTGLAEIVPALGVPLTITDMMVLSKVQAFLVYRLDLALGFSTRWQDYVAEFGSVLGSEFVWRQVARELIGLVPVWGIVPKVAIAYPGTYVTGNVVLQWYLTGRHVTREQIRTLYGQALAIGKASTRDALPKMPRPRLSFRRRRKVAPLPAPHMTAGAHNAHVNAALMTPAGKLPVFQSATPAAVGDRVQSSLILVRR